MEPITFTNFVWALSIVCSRQNLIKNSGLTLIPLWDFCNHENGELSSSFEEEKCVAYAKRDFKIGTEIFIHYGNRTNFNLFLYSGFVVKNVLPWDIVNVDFQIDESSEVNKAFNFVVDIVKIIAVLNKK